MSSILILIAVICFVLAAFGVPFRVDLVAVGLAFWAASHLAGAWTPSKP